MDPGHLLHSALTSPSSANARRLKSRHPFGPPPIPAVRRTGRITNGMRSRRTTPQDSAFSFQRSVPTLLEWPSQAEPGAGLTACAPLSGVSAPACTNGVWPPVWRRRTNRRPCCPPLTNTSTSSWTAWSDGSGRWVYRMAAQHLPRDRVRPSSGYKNWPKRWRRSSCVITQAQHNALLANLNSLKVHGSDQTFVLCFLRFCKPSGTQCVLQKSHVELIIRIFKLLMK